MSERRQVWQALTSILRRVEKSIPASTNSDSPGMEQEIRKLGKAQFKANALAEEQAARLEKALATAQATQDQNARLLMELSEGRAANDQKALLEAILPALDGVDNAIASGKRYLQTRDVAACKTDLTPAQAILVSPADRAMLAGWLDGLRLVRQRLLDILAAGKVTPILAVGEPFDPYHHVAVGTSNNLPDGIAAAPGVIIAEERTGYQSPAGVIRYAEVIVYRPTAASQP